MTKKFGGCLVALEGIDRAGKSSIIKRIPELLADCRRPVVICAERESPIGDQLTPEALPGLSPFVKTYFFAADRAWVFENRCLPALKSGSLVVWDRYAGSAVAYRAVDLRQDHELFDMAFVEAINSPFPQPDLTVFVDVSPATSEQRAKSGERPQPYSVQYLQRVHQVYADLAGQLPSVKVDGEADPGEVARQVAEAIKVRFPEFFDEP